jgi:protein O-GlcNAc transferase
MSMQKALALHQKGALTEAEAAYLALLAQSPQEPDVMHMLALICRDSARVELALSWMQRAAQHGANGALFYANFAGVCLAAGHPAAALSHAERALQMQPTHFGALHNKALALTELAQFQQALPALEHALQTRFTAALLRARVRALQALQPKAVLSALTHLCQQFPTREHWFLLGKAQSDAGQVIAAIAALEHALGLEFSKTQSAGLPSPSGVSAPPKDTRLLLAVANADCAKTAEAVRQYDLLLAAFPDYYQAASNRLIALQHLPAMDPAWLLEEHQTWAQRFAPCLPVRSGAPPCAARRAQAKTGPLRVAFLSPRLSDGPVSTFLLPLLQALDRSRIEPVLVDLSGVADTKSVALREASAFWIDASALSDLELQQRLAATQVDIAIDCAGHAPGNRLQAFAQGLAPVQLTWLDYFSSTGLDAFDALLSDWVLTPAGDECHFSEAVYRLPHGRLCYSPPLGAPDVVPRGSAPLRFGNFNRLAKYTPEAAAMWCALLQALPDAQLELRAGAFSDAATAEDCYQSFFAPHQIARERIVMFGRCSYLEALHAYQHIDIALDTFPFSGCATTCDALWMGVPVSTYSGATMVSRQSASVLTHMGLGDLVSVNAEQWLAQTLNLAADAPRRAKLRVELRARMQASVANATLHAAAFCDAMWALHQTQLG